MKQKTKQPGSTRRQSSWEQHLHDLKEFKKKYGHCDVPNEYQQNPAMGHWVARVRQAKKLDTIAEDKTLILDALGFTWIINRQGMPVPWKQRINDLKAFKKEHGHCNVPQKYQPNPALGRWVSRIRRERNDCNFTKERVRCLDALGFCWLRRPSMAVWDQRFKELNAFKKKYGHCNIPSVYTPNLVLSSWVYCVRNARKHGKLTEERVRCLDALGFDWARELSWKQRINDLEAFKKEHGHCNVPFRYSLNPILGRWISTVRYAKKQGTLAKKRVHCLNALGFVWVREVSWEQRIHDLKAFKKKHGHCNVPNRYSLKSALGWWVTDVRNRKKRGKLDTDRILMLDALGFCWELRTTWEQRISDLKAFKKDHGHCNVPQKYQPNPALGTWVAKLRQWKKRGKLTEDRILILDALGFVWEGLKRGRPKHR